MSNHSQHLDPVVDHPMSVRLGRLPATLIVWVVALLVVGACNSMPPSPPPTATPASPSLAATRIPGIAATVTAVRQLPTLVPVEAGPYNQIGVLVRACDELHPNRRRAILQHLAWLTNPDKVPAEFIVLYGNAWRGRLVFGAAYLTAVEWKVRGREPGSCLIMIGSELNVILVAMGEEPVSEFVEVGP